MKFKNLLTAMATYMEWIDRKIIFISAATVFAMMLLTTVDVVGRYIFNHPVKGSNDISELMLIPLVFLGLSYVQLEKGHVRVELLYSRFSAKAQLVLDTITGFLSAAIAGLIAWGLSSQFLLSVLSEEPGERSMLLNIPHLPFLLIAAIGCLLLFFQLFLDAVHALFQKVKG